MEIDRTYVYYFKDGCKLHFHLFNKSSFFYYHNLDIVNIYTHNKSVEIHFYYKDTMIYMSLFKAKLFQKKG